jgi:hypothetical protein
MLAIVPLCFANQLEEDFWKTPLARAHIHELVSILADMEQVRQVLLLAPCHGWADSWAAKVTVLPVDWEGTKIREELDASPAFLTSPRLLALLQQLAPEKKQTLFCVDFRNVSLTREHLTEALAAYHAAGGGMVVSIRGMSDHPCQCKRYFNVLDVGVVPVGPDGQVDDGEGGVFQTPCGPGNRAEICCESVKNALSEDECAGSLRLSFPQAAGHEHVVVALQTVVPPGHVPVPAQELVTSFAAGYEVRLTVGNPAPTEVLFALLSPVKHGVYDVVGPVEPLGGLWHANRDGAPVRTRDGKTIIGRQDFPPLFELEGRLLIMEAGLLPKAEDILAQGEAIGFTLPRGLIVLRNPCELVLAQAMLHLALIRREVCTGKAERLRTSRSV